MDPISDVRPPTLIDRASPAGAPAGDRHWTGRGQNFSVAWTQAGPGGGTRVPVESSDEILMVVLDAPAAITGRGATHTVPPRSVCILPPGAWRLDLDAGATGVVLASLREGATAGALNEAAYQPRDERIAPVGAPWRAVREAGEIRVFSIDSVQASVDKPRLKMLQTATLSINWVEYDGPRDRRALSPHSHGAFEQGSLALAGDFTHHLRVLWGADADAWIDDRHETLGSPSLMVVPVETIHTSEGVGPGRHLLIDVFSPPRADFIAKGWVANSADYAAPAAV
jgi:mannose-6-phosphate isomerase-like protein (cupin superfamily)